MYFIYATQEKRPIYAIISRATKMDIKLLALGIFIQEIFNSISGVPDDKTLVDFDCPGETY